MVQVKAWAMVAIAKPISSTADTSSMISIGEVKAMSDTTTLTDEALVDYIRTTDKEQYAVIIKRYQAKLLRYVGFIFGDNHQAADVVQDTFIKAYVNLNSFDVTKKFSSWLYRIAHNQAVNQFRRQPHQNLEDHMDLDSGVAIEDDLIRQELAKHAHRCLDRISLIYKEPLSLFYLQDKSYEEISDILRLPIGTVGTRINRAKIIMRHLCQPHSKK